MANIRSGSVPLLSVSESKPLNININNDYNNNVKITFEQSKLRNRTVKKNYSEVRSIKHSAGFITINNTRRLTYNNIFANYLPLFLCCIYHLFNISYACIGIIIPEEWCIAFQSIINILQFQSFALYLIAYKAFQYDKNDKVLNRNFKEPPKMVIFFCATLILISWITGFIVLVMTPCEACKTVHFLRYANWIYYALDLFRFWQTTAVVFILYGFLNSFPDKIDQFYTKTIQNNAHNVSDEDYAVNNGNHRFSSVSSSKTVRNKIDSKYSIVRLDKYDHAHFMELFSDMTLKYKAILGQFWWFIVIFFIFDLITWLIMVFTLALSFKKEQCDGAKHVAIYTHYISEIMLYFGLWALIAFKLNRNHNLIEKYRNRFSLTVATDSNKSHEKLIILDYLDTISNSESPFAIFGTITPNNAQIILLFTGIAFPLTTSIFQFVF